MDNSNIESLTQKEIRKKYLAIRKMQLIKAVSLRKKAIYDLIHSIQDKNIKKPPIKVA